MSDPSSTEKPGELVSAAIDSDTELQAIARSSETSRCQSGLVG
jgi:hypothetical protein